MPTIIRKIVGDRLVNAFDVAEGWRLREQIEDLEKWMRENRAELGSSEQWVADVGFCHREDAMGGGPPITLELMRWCVESNLEIWLSEYPGDHDE